ncbi:helix-turn-helix domain-containing protein [Micromonosporaceae bacterium Da 78-11]
MQDREDVVTLSARTLRGLAHPLRVRLLNLLRERGPSTASRLADQLGQSSGATSYHLRRLESYGFVVDDPGRGNARERWWQAAHRGTVLDATTSRAAGDAAEVYLRSVAAADHQRLETFFAELPTVPQEWQDAFWMSTSSLRLTAGRAVELRGRLDALIAEYTSDEPGAELVSMQWQLFPQIETPTGTLTGTPPEASPKTTGAG